MRTELNAPLDELKAQIDGGLPRVLLGLNGSNDLRIQKELCFAAGSASWTAASVLAALLAAPSSIGVGSPVLWFS